MEEIGPKVIYHWAEAAVPPPDHYEIEIQLHHTTGSIKFWPDYPGEGTPSWESSFSLNDHDRDHLLQKIITLHDTEWKTHSPPNLGGATEWLEIHGGEDKVVIPPDLIREQMVKVSLLYEHIRGLVPPDIWKDFMQRRRTYQQISGY